MKPPRVITVIQARFLSTRLPGKVLLPLGDSTVLEQTIARVALARLAGTIVVATTEDPSDDGIAMVCARLGVDYYRGHRTDLLDRHYQLALRYRAQHVVKIPADCPLIDPAVIDRVLGAYLDQPGRFDYVSNLHPATYPDGNDVEVMRATALRDAWLSAEQPHEREHTTPFIWDRPRRFRIGNVAWETGEDLSRLVRYVLDYREDHEVIGAVFDGLGSTESLRVDAIVNYLRSHPEVAARNAMYRGVNWYRRHLGELQTVSEGDTAFAPGERQWR